MVQPMNMPSKKKILAPIVNVIDAPENLYLPKAEFVKKRRVMKEARLKAEEAFIKEMTERLGSENIGLKNAEDEVRKKRQLLATLTQALDNLEKDITEASDGEIRSIKIHITKTKNKIEEAKQKLADAEKVYDKAKMEASNV